MPGKKLIKKHNARSKKSRYLKKLPTYTKKANKLKKITANNNINSDIGTQTRPNL